VINRYSVIVRVSIGCALANFFLGSLQLSVGWIFFSWSLIADGLHTLSDLWCDGLVFLGAKFSSAPPDIEHPYGHQKFETMATVLMAAFLMVIASLLLWEVVFSEYEVNIPPGPWLYLVALYSVIQNELLYRYATYQAKKINSDLLFATAWHQRSDALSSFIVLLSLMARHYGFQWADQVAAGCIAFFIYKMAFSILLRAVHELLDTAVTAKELESIQAIIIGHDQVRGCDRVRTRRVSGQIYLDAKVILRSGLTLKEADAVKLNIQSKLKKHPELKIVDCLLDVLSE
jgi:cation diffusion facilitator family transporter